MIKCHGILVEGIKILVLLGCCLYVPSIHSFSFISSTLTPAIQVDPVRTQGDITALADLRYDEWIDNSSNEGKEDLGTNPLPSRYAFRMATAEIIAERGNATAFLARRENIVLGAAELSPIEFCGAVLSCSGDEDTGGSNSQRTMLYITDVVTSHNFRRLGVANSLMDAVERYAHLKHGDGTVLCLHVKSENEPALQFYSNPKRGYGAPTPELLKYIDVGKLEQNSGTTGQILLCKDLAGSCVERSQETWNTNKAAANGFGVPKHKKSAARPKKSKRKKRQRYS